jgi:outer membrane protein assembly factor BamB
MYFAILMACTTPLAWAGELQPWPMASGPYGNYLPLQDENVEFVDDLSAAKLLWESKCDHFGWVKTTSNMAGTIYGDHMKGHPGSGATPIVADGKIFHSSFRASGPLELGRNVDTYVKSYRERKGSVDPDRVRFLRESVRLPAEDIVFALDVETGKLAWEAIEPGGVNLAAGKRDIWKPSPVYLDGKVFALGTTGMIRAYNATSGEKLWETSHPLMRDKILSDLAAAKSRVGHGRNALSYQFDRDLFAVDGRVIVPSFGDPIGLDVETGKVVWRLSGKKNERIQGTFSNPGIWRHDDKHYLVYAGTGSDRKGMLSLVDPVDGEIVWKRAIGVHPNSVTVVGDIAFVSVADQSLPRKSGSQSEDVTQTLMGGVRLSLTGADVAWTLPKGSVKYAYNIRPDRGPRRHAAAGAGSTILYNSQGGAKNGDTERLFAIDAKAGKIMAEASLPKCTSPYPYQVGDRVIVFADGAHKNNRAKLFSLPDLKLLTDVYNWQHFGTSAYELNIEHPIVGGRIYIRTGDGTLACYDLRKQK